jgi:hypothetical protein
MDVKRYAVSIQWGKGMHYFKATDLIDYTAAEQLAHAELRLALKTKQNSAKSPEPTIHIWELKENLHSLS